MRVIGAKRFDPLSLSEFLTLSSVMGHEDECSRLAGLQSVIDETVNTDAGANTFSSLSLAFIDGRSRCALSSSNKQLYNEIRPDGEDLAFLRVVDQY